jgi:hypothetical protein
MDNRNEQETTQGSEEHSGESAPDSGESLSAMGDSDRKEVERNFSPNDVRQRIQYRRGKRRKNRGKNPELCGTDCERGIREVGTIANGCIKIIHCAAGKCQEILRICPEEVTEK